MNEGPEQMISETKMSDYERIEMQKEAEVEVVSQMTRRKAVIIITVLAIVVAIIFIIASAIITSQILNVVGAGPEPPISTYIVSTPVIGCTAQSDSSGTCNGIPQGGMLISRPNFMYTMVFTTTLTLNFTGTTSGGIIWESEAVKNANLLPGSQALLQLNDMGILLIWIPDSTPDGKVVVVSTNEPGESGNYMLQVTEFQSPNQQNAWGGQLQIINPNGAIVWSVGIPYISE
jgi:hypothetical protein